MARELRDWRHCLAENYRAACDQARLLPLPDGTEIPFGPIEPEFSLECSDGVRNTISL